MSMETMSAFSVLATRDTSSTHAAEGVPLSAGKSIASTAALGGADAISLAAFTMSREAGRASALTRGTSTYVPTAPEFS